MSVPTASFNEEFLKHEEYRCYGLSINAKGLLVVRKRDYVPYSDEDEYLSEDFGYTWFLIEHISKEKFFLDTTEKYFLRNDPRYTYTWIAFRK